MGVGQGPIEDDDREVGIWRGEFFWADGICVLGVLDRCEFAVELSRVKDILVVLLRLVPIDVEQPLLVGELAANTRSLRFGGPGPVEDEKDREVDIRGGGVVRLGSGGI